MRFMLVMYHCIVDGGRAVEGGCVSRANRRDTVLHTADDMHSCMHALSTAIHDTEVGLWYAKPETEKKSYHASHTDSYIPSRVRNTGWLSGYYTRQGKHLEKKRKSISFPILGGFICLSYAIETLCSQKLQTVHD